MASNPTSDTPPPSEAGQYGGEAVRRGLVELAFALTALVAVTVVLAFAVGLRSPLLAVVGVIAIAGVLTGARTIDARSERGVRGIRGQERVAGILDDLVSEAWRTVHDGTLRRGIIDHIVVGPGGILTVETKSHGGRRRVSRLDPRWLKQANTQRESVEGITGEPVDSLLVFSHASLDHAVSRQRGVIVLPARMLPRYIVGRRTVYSSEQVASIHERLRLAVADDERQLTHH